MININEKFYKLATLLIILCFCFVVTGCKKNVQSSQDGWTCTWGTVNTGNFCGNCGKQKGEYTQKQATNSNPFKNAKVGDYVKFGNYPQTEEGEEKPIEWQVLAKEANKMLVISEYGLDAKRFDDDSNVWANSEIRQWLNGEFYNKAFNGKERKLINSSNLSDADAGTSDNVFLLSKEEAEKYFVDDEARRCKATDYAKNNGAYVNSDNGYSYWWLRSPNPYGSNYVYGVFSDGYIDYFSNVNLDDFLARPALWINL